MIRRSYYSILGVAPDADARSVKSAFRALARRHHPDRAGADGAPLFKKIVEAYDVLSDPGQRASYDEGLTPPRAASPHAPQRHAPRPHAPQPRASAPEPLIPEPLIPELPPPEIRASYVSLRVHLRVPWPG